MSNTWLKWTITLVVVTVILLCLTNISEAAEEKSAAPTIESVLYEYDLRKQKSYREKFCRNQYLVNHGLPYNRICPDFNRHYLKFFFSLFAIIAIGAGTRTFLRVFELNVPYTVILMIFGLLIGFGTREDSICTFWSMYTRIARTPPKIILFVFLPVLIYESAYAMKAHVFYRSALSILILALPGMLITTFLTAFLCKQFFFAYKWEFTVACLYGSIISATDPVAVVAILKEIGTSEMLSITIEGESLLNDGVAILLYEIFMEVVKPHQPGEHGITGGEIFGMFCRIAIGGPAFGFVMAKLSIFFLSFIFNDAAVEVSITLVAAYLTYYIGEAFLEVSGVMAVVALGIVMSAERTCISPEVQGLVHHFWEMLGYLANTVLFVLVGVVISETAINSVTLEDGYYLIFLYFALNIARFLMIIILSPILSHVGYGLSWQNLIVMTWGGLRGAVGICLALEVFKDRNLCDKTEIGPKFLLQTAGIVLLTLIINGTTTKALLDMLKLTELSIGRIQDMGNAVKLIQAAQFRAIGAMKHDRLLADCNFELVEVYTNIEDPYSKHNVKAKKATGAEILETSTEEEDLAIVLPESEEKVDREPSPEEYREMTEEARLRLLKAMKVSCWRQYEQGALTEESIQILVDYMDRCEDKHFKMFHTADLKKYWEIRGAIAWMRNKLLPFTVGQLEDEDLPSIPEAKWRRGIYRMVTNDWFDGIIHTIILLNMVPIIWETVDIISNHHFSSPELIGFLVTNAIFTVILIFEFLLKVTAFGCAGYFSSKWNILDTVVLLVCIVEVCLSITYVSRATEDYTTQAADTEFLKFLRFIRIVRVIRILRLFRPLLPQLMNFLNGRVNQVLFFGYDVAKGSATAIDDVLKFLPQMIENQKIYTKFFNVLCDQRLILLLEMGLLQIDHPGIAIAAKTRHANRAVLNQMRAALKELKEDGLVDEKEFDILFYAIESKMKGLWHTPPYMSPRLPEMLIADLQWVSGSTELFAYLLQQATVVNFALGDSLYSTGDEPNGVYVIVSGVVKVDYTPSYEIIQALEEKGILPNMEIFCELKFDEPMVDYFSTGSVIDEMGVITGQTRAASVSCETAVVAYHIPQSAMLSAIESFADPYDSLEGRLWRTCAMRVACSILPLEPAFHSWTMDRIKTHVEISAVPVGDQYLTLSFPEFVSDVILAFGQVVNFHNPTDIYTAPCLIPRTVAKVKPIEDWEVRPRILIIAKEGIENFEQPSDGDTPVSKSTTDIHRYMMTATRPAGIEEADVKRMNRPSVAVNFGVRQITTSESQLLTGARSRTSNTTSRSQAGDND